ncbi:MAG: hypothetical protein IKU97_01730 [Tidjanibacter sp.]|nr:hypothetical protein [Tidjanibacter sp.]
MKQILKFAMLVLAAAIMWSCYEEPQPLDKPFVYIQDEAGGSKMDISAQGNNIVSDLRVYLSCKRFTEPILVHYDVIVGDGLKEGVDFVIQPTTKSPLTFKPGTYDLPVRISWKKSENFDATKDNTVTITLKEVESNIGEFYLGLLGPDHLRSTYVFTKK